MTFAAIPRGSSVFIDANTFAFDFSMHPQYGVPCRDLLERIARGELLGFTSAHVLCDLAHRAMTIEAMNQFNWPQTGIAARLRKHPAEVQQLTRFRQATDSVSQAGIQVLPIDVALVSAATSLSQKHGLLTGDALIVAVMQAHGLTNLASLDADFDRVPGLTRYVPV
jgi:predicted nucleic acid-binding protein